MPTELQLVQLSGALGGVGLMFFEETRRLAMCGLSGVGTLNALSMVEETGLLVWSAVAVGSSVVCAFYAGPIGYKAKPWFPWLRKTGKWFVDDYKTWRNTQ